MVVGKINGISMVHGATMHDNITRKVFLTAFKSYVEAGTPTSLGIEGGENADEPAVYFFMEVPTDFVSFTKVEAIWYAGAAAGNMYWQFATEYQASGEAVGTHMDAPDLGATANGGPWVQNVQEPANALTLASLAVGDFISINFYREGSDALDTLNEACYLFGLLFTYVASQ